MCCLVVRTLDRLVLWQLLATLKTERVTAWQRQRLLVIVIVCFEADTALEDGLHVVMSELQLVIIGCALSVCTSFTLN